MQICFLFSLFKSIWFLFVALLIYTLDFQCLFLCGSNGAYLDNSTVTKIKYNSILIDRQNLLYSFFSGFFCCCSPSLSSDCKFDDFKSSVRRDFLKWQENNVRFLFCSTYFLKVVLDWTVFSETLCYGVGQINVHPKCKTEALNTRSFSRRILVDFFLFIYFFLGRFLSLQSKRFTLTTFHITTTKCTSARCD